MDNFCEYFIDKKALIDNVKTIRRKLANGCKFCAVVKGDCYGLGIENVVPLIDDYVDFYAVSNIGECKRLKAFTNHRVLLLSEVFLDDIEYCVENNVSVSVSNLQPLEMMEKSITNGYINIHIKINSGMNRYGVKSELLFKKCLNFIKKSKHLKLEGVYTHFATRQENISFLLNQLDFFKKIIKNLNYSTLLVHCNNSYASLDLGLKFGNMVRIGMGMYIKNGYKTITKNVVKITSKVLHITRVKKGECVGYDCGYVAEKDMKIGVVGMGYADGFSRGLSNKFHVLINGQKANVVGFVCMDCFMVDLTNIKNVFVGSEVVVLGDSGNETLTLFDYANVLNTSPYEVLTSFNTKRCNVVVK